MPHYFKVRITSTADAVAIDKIAIDLGLQVTGMTTQQARLIECKTLDDWSTAREIFKELGYQTQRVFN